MKRILAFEGDQAFAAELKAYLWRRGCALEVVDDAEEGITRALDELPDLILLAIELPKVNGFSVCSRLKRNKVLRAVPLIILSSECSDETFLNHQKMESRAEAYFRKPVDCSSLFKAVSQLIDLQTAAPGQIAAMRPVLVTDDDMDKPTGAAPITAIFNSIDGAFDNIQDAEEGDSERVTKPSEPPIDDDQALPSTENKLCPTVIGLWSPDARVRGQCFIFPKGKGSSRLSGGRESQNSIVVDDEGVSGDHFLLEKKDKGVFIRDLGSGKGTFVDGELLSRQQLHGGEVIRFGETTLLYLQNLGLEAQLEGIVRELTEVDQYTRTMSRRALRERLDVELLLASQEATPLTVAVVGIDELRRIAYRYGEHVADRVMGETASLLKVETSGVVVGRDLCDDFLVVMPDTTERVGVAHAEGWRFEASVSEVLTESHAVKFTLSAGVIELRDGWTVTDMLRRAYRLLWEVQLAGGNRVASRGAHDSKV